MSSLRFIYSILFFIFLGCNAFAQENVTPLRYNKTIHNEWIKIQNSPQISYKKKKDTLLDLPFVDDFSDSKIYPNANKWIDRSVYVNNSFAVNPPSLGVATFDGLNKQGYPYDDNGANASKSCDTLTSQPINLEGFKGSDSVILSFYWQQKGLGDSPENNDSLLLEFLPQDSAKGWQAVWRQAGSIDSFGNFPFKIQLIHIDTSIKHNYFYKGFQFRFRSIGNRTGSLDHWNLDYVILDKNRTMRDSVPNDFALYQKPKGITKIYTSMPWAHFYSKFNTYLATDVEFNMYNNWENDISPLMYYEIRDSIRDKELSNSQSIGETPTFTPQQRSERKQTLNLPVLSLDGQDNEKLVLQLKIRTVPNLGDDKLPFNDSYVHNQRFYNYFAYDDGSAERGYGLLNIRYGSVALGFTTSFEDTLKYVAFHFTGGYEALPVKQKFNLMIWKQLQPETILLKKITGFSPVYSDVIQGWTAYKLDTPIAVSGEFFVGWEQYRSYNLNVGLDVNYNYFNENAPNPNLFFNAAGQWENSKVQGTPMIRPVFGDDIILNTNKIVSQTTHVNIFPNPTKGVFNVQTNLKSAVLYNDKGMVLQNIEFESNTQTIDLSTHKAGLYFLRFNNGTVKKIIRL